MAPAEKEKLDDLQKMSLKRKAQLHEIEQSLPAKSGRYLQVKGGGVGLHLKVTFLSFALARCQLKFTLNEL